MTMNYLERRKVCKDYYRKCRKGRRDKRRSALRSLLFGDSDDRKGGDGCQEPPSQ